MSIESQLYSRLSGSAELAAIVADRIFPGDPPTDETHELPLLAFGVSDSEDVSGNGSLTRYGVEFVIVSDDSDEVATIRQTLRDLLHLQSWGQVQGGFAQEGDTDADQGEGGLYFVGRQSFNFFFESDVTVEYEPNATAKIILTADNQIKLCGELVDCSGNIIGIGPYVPRPVRTVTGDTIATDTDWLILVNATTFHTRVVLPTASSMTGRTFRVVKIDNAPHEVGVAPVNGQLIAGLPAFILVDRGESVEFTSDGSNWWA